MRDHTVPALLLGLSLVVAAIILATTWRGNVEIAQTLRVTGSATMDLSSDLGRLQFWVRGEGRTAEAAWQDLQRQIPVVKGYLADQATELHRFRPPEPWGLEVEWVFGEGPAHNDAGTGIVSDDRDGFSVLGSCKMGRHIAVVRYDEMSGWAKLPGRPPTRSDFDRWSLGYVYELSGRNRISVEYDIAELNHQDADQLGFQLQVVF